MHVLHMINWRKHVCLLWLVTRATHVWLAAAWPVISAKHGQQAKASPGLVCCVLHYRLGMVHLQQPTAADLLSVGIGTGGTLIVGG